MSEKKLGKTKNSKRRAEVETQKLRRYPINGKYGKYGGVFVPEVLMQAVTELEAAYK